ncbi:hypothetical protein TKK_0010529 [Trichogramma kaykai]|uniref:DNA replication complex GINS protein SLD5 n=1 Tax=Trichogramma kaykai TaxID=54128 RepID=A0ABD2WVC4_9HYME
MDVSNDSNGLDNSAFENGGLNDAEAEFESDEEELTSDKALQVLESAWLNEKFAPELLPHQQLLVECMVQQIKHMEENVQRLTKGDIRINIHTMEICRIRFIISSYLRKRLDKIEEFAVHLLKEDARRSPDEKYMTTAEAQFARDYLTNIEKLFETVALQHMPQRCANFDLDAISMEPNLKKHVFARANKDIPTILISGVHEMEVSFAKGSQHIIQYSAIAHLVKDGSVQLI